LKSWHSHNGRQQQSCCTLLYSFLSPLSWCSPTLTLTSRWFQCWVSDVYPNESHTLTTAGIIFSLSCFQTEDSSGNFECPPSSFSTTEPRMDSTPSHGLPRHSGEGCFLDFLCDCPIPSHTCTISLLCLSIDCFTSHFIKTPVDRIEKWQLGTGG
jgi:hypothetical protein